MAKRQADWDLPKWRRVEDSGMDDQVQADLGFNPFQEVQVNPVPCLFVDEPGAEVEIGEGVIARPGNHFRDMTGVEEPIDRDDTATHQMVFDRIPFKSESVRAEFYNWLLSEHQQQNEPHEQAEFGGDQAVDGS